MKQNYNFLMHPDTHRRLKTFAAENGLSMGEGIHLLLDRHGAERRTNTNAVLDFLRGGIDLNTIGEPKTCTFRPE
jgi:hypothetical protein